MARARHPNYRKLSTLPVELRRTTVPEQVRAWVTQRVGVGITKTVRLTGASSASIHRIDLADGRRVVVRRYVWRRFVETEPDAPAREADALRFAYGHGLKVPEVIAADTTGDEIGDGVPVILMTYLPGQPVASPDPRRLAETAAAIHAVDATDLGHEYFPWYEAEMTTPPPLTTRPELWEHAIELWRNALPSYRPVLIHRDFHPGNVLWSRRTVTGVVDWASACRGPAGCDVATCWSNLVDWAGPEVAESFVGAHESITGEQLNPFWQMANLLEAGRSHWTSENLAKGEPELTRLVNLLT